MIEPAPSRVLIGGIGYPDLCDYSAGVLAVEALAREAWPTHVVIEDISYNPVAVAQWLQAEPAGRVFTRAIIIAAAARGRPGGTLSVYRWDHVLPDDVEIHRSVCDAVTGVIHLDNTLVVVAHLRALPAEVVVMEIEPVVHEFGQSTTPVVAAAVRTAGVRARQLACEHDAALALPQLPLGGDRPFQVVR
ncbi:hypothetical protein BH23GEM9_BH23GEM9_30370 [soil metagenome]